MQRSIAQHVLSLPRSLSLSLSRARARSLPLSLTEHIYIYIYIQSKEMEGKVSEANKITSAALDTGDTPQKLRYFSI